MNRSRSASVTTVVDRDWLAEIAIVDHRHTTLRTIVNKNRYGSRMRLQRDLRFEGNCHRQRIRKVEAFDVGRSSAKLPHRRLGIDGNAALFRKPIRRSSRASSSEIAAYLRDRSHPAMTFGISLSKTIRAASGSTHILNSETGVMFP